MNDKAVEKGDDIKFSYTAKLKGGSVFDTSDTPITSEIGTGKLIKGLDEGMLGMVEGEEKSIEISPDQGYGNEDPGAVSTIPRKEFHDHNIDPEIGLRVKTPEGTCYVTKVSGEDVEVNYNHPLAGKTLIFDVKVEDIAKK